MRLECKTFKQNDKFLSSTVTWVLPLDDRYTETVPLILNDDTGKPVTLYIEMRPDISQLNPTAREQLQQMLSSTSPAQQSQEQTS